MAEIYRKNGDVGAIGTFVSFIGKTPKCYGIKLLSNDLSTAANLQPELGPNDAVQGIMKRLTGNATILGYQIENVNTGNLSVMFEAPSELTATQIRDIIRTGGVAGNGWYGNAATLDCSGTLVTDVGFKLAYS